jgi:acyl-CoA:acyl-CoA alkyltransferase
MVRERNAGMISIASYLPPEVRTSEQLEDLIDSNSPDLDIPRGLIEAATGVQERRVAELDTNASDLAAGASLVALERADMTASDIDLIIFASASQDIVEPATANIVQQKIGGKLPRIRCKECL